MGDSGSLASLPTLSMNSILSIWPSLHQWGQAWTRWLFHWTRAQSTKASWISLLLNILTFLPIHIFHWQWEATFNLYFTMVSSNTIYITLSFSNPSSVCTHFFQHAGHPVSFPLCCFLFKITAFAISSVSIEYHFSIEVNIPALQGFHTDNDLNIPCLYTSLSNFDQSKS